MIDDLLWLCLVALLVLLNRYTAVEPGFELTALWSVWLALLVCAFRFLVALSDDDPGNT